MPRGYSKAFVQAMTAINSDSRRKRKQLDQTEAFWKSWAPLKFQDSSESGKRLFSVKQVYAQYGEPSSACDNVVLICHALTGSHHVAGDDVEASACVVAKSRGPGKAIIRPRFAPSASIS